MNQRDLLEIRERNVAATQMAGIFSLRIGIRELDDFHWYFQGKGEHFRIIIE